MDLMTTILNRSSYLEKSLPTWLNKGFQNIYVIDWSSTENVKEIVDKYQDGSIVYVRIEGQQYYNHSKAKNLRARFSKDWFLSIDCDVKLRFLPESINTDECYVGRRAGAWGTHLIHRDTYFSVNGHNENLRGNVGDDGEFYNRLMASGILINKLEGLNHIHHSNQLRRQYMEEKLEGAWNNDSVMQKFECEIIYPDNTIEQKII